MKYTTCALLGAILISTASPMALAGPEHADLHEDRPEHYLVEIPETEQQALALLEEKLDELQPIMARESLSDNDLEAIHEISYSLEASVDRLRKEIPEAHEAALDRLDEAVQAIHYASESHDVNETRKWFAVLEPAAQEVQQAFPS